MKLTDNHKQVDELKRLSDRERTTKQAVDRLVASRRELEDQLAAVGKLYERAVANHSTAYAEYLACKSRLGLL